MATVRSLEDATKPALGERAARHDRSMESEARHILADALSRDAQPTDLIRATRGHFADSTWDPNIVPPRGTENQQPVALPQIAMGV